MLNQLAYQYYDYNDSLAFFYANEALRLGQAASYPQGVKYANTMVGLGYASKGEFRTAIRYYSRANNIKVVGAEKDDVYNFGLWGNCYRETAYYDSALLIYRKAMTLVLANDVENLAHMYKNVASVYVLLWRNQEAIHVLDSAMVLLAKDPAKTHYIRMDIWSVYQQAHKNLLNYAQAEEFGRKMCREAYSLDDYYHQVMCKLNQGELQFQQSKYSDALKSNFDALELTRRYMFPPQYAKLLIQIGEVYEELSQFNVAAEYFFNCIRLAERHGLRAELATCYAELAWIKKDQHDYVMALTYADRSMALRQAIGDAKGIANCHNVIGLVYLLQKKYDRSIAEHQQALQIREKIGYELGISASIFNISLVYEALGQIDKALEYQRRAIVVEEKANIPQSLAISYNSLARLLVKSGQTGEALLFARKAQMLAGQTGSLLLMRNNNDIFSACYEAMGDYKNALQYRKKYQQFNDSVYSDISAIKMAEVEAMYHVEEKNRDIEALQQKQVTQANQMALQQAELARKNWILTTSGISIVLLLAAGIVGYRYYREKSKVNRELLEQREEIQAQSEELIEASQTIAHINKELENKIDARTQELKQAYKELDTFFYRSSHDFRRPITTFLGLAGVAKITVKDPVSLELFEKVSETAGSLDKMLQKLQSISDVGAQQMLFKEVFLKEICNDIVEGLEPMILAKKITVQSVIDEQVPLVSYPAMVKIIVENLIENAIHFATVQEPYVRITARIDEHLAVFEVEDNGQGIREEYISRIFEMYFRANEHSKGNGLGLYIAKKAVEKLNGTIRFKTRWGVGTVFTVELPNRQA